MDYEQRLPVGQHIIRSAASALKGRSPGPLAVVRTAPPARDRPATIAEQLGAVRATWSKCQSCRDRDVIYHYLAAVFALVGRWDKEARLKEGLHGALKLLQAPLPMKIGEAFSLVIYCTSDPGKVDAKTRSKWSRVLRYAAEFMPDGESLRSFLKRHGGLNACARQFARTLGRGE